MTAATKEILEACESLTPEKQAVVVEFVRSLLEGDGDVAWERIIDDPRRRPKLDEFLAASRAEGSAEPLDFGR